MKKHKFICFIIFVLVFGFLANYAFAAKKVVVISGPSETNAKESVYPILIEGINGVFKPAGIVTEYHWANIDSQPNAAAKEAAGMAAIAKARASKPDAIIILNDDCLKYVGTKIDDIPIVFAYVFGKPAAFGLPKANVTGVTRRSYGADIWAMAKTLFGAKTVAMLSKRTASMEGVRKYMLAGADKYEAISGVRFKEMYLLDTLEEWKNAVKNFPEDFIYLADTSRIKDGERTVPRAEITGWTVANSKVKVVAATEADVASGALYAIVTSENAIGANAAKVAVKILNGTAPADIPYVQSKKGKLVINAKTVKLYNLEIPYDILSSADKIYE